MYFYVLLTISIALLSTKLKVLVLSKHFVHAHGRGSCPGVVWCTNNVLLLLLLLLLEGSRASMGLCVDLSSGVLI